MFARDNLSWVISKVEKSRLVLPRGHSLLLRKRKGPLFSTSARNVCYPQKGLLLKETGVDNSTGRHLFLRRVVRISRQFKALNRD